MSTTDSLTVELDADEANAVVYAITRAVTTEGAGMESMPINSPGDMFRIAAPCRRIARLTAVNDQLLWRKHFGRLGGEPPAVTTTTAVLLEVATELHKLAEEQRVDPEGGAWEDGPLSFESAARKLARAFAGSDLETAGRAA